EFVHLVAELADRAGLPMPRVYIMDNPQPNAFATGRNPQNAAVAATTGLLNMLSRDEIAGVISHELAHIKNRDTLLMTITATIAGVISMLAQFGMFFGGGHRDRNGNSGMGNDRNASDGRASTPRGHVRKGQDYMRQRRAAKATSSSSSGT